MFKDRNGQPFFGRNALIFVVLFALAVAGKYALDQYWGYRLPPVPPGFVVIDRTRPQGATTDPEPPAGFVVVNPSEHQRPRQSPP